MRQTDRQELPQGEEKRQAVKTMFDTIAPRYDMVNRLMTFRLDVRWRNKTIKALKLEPNSIVLDLASGTGDFCTALSKAGHQPIGIDLSFGMLSAAKHSEPNVQGDLLALPVATNSADAAVCGFALRNLVALEPFFEELRRVTKPGGRIALLDVSKPDNKLVGFGHNIYFNRIVPKVGGLLSDRKAYSYLPKSVSYLPPRREIIEMLKNTGFNNVDHSQLTGGLSQLFVAD